MLLLAGCSSLLYYPTQHQYVITEKLPIQPEEVTFASEDGTTQLHAWMFKSPTDKPKATVIHFHGNGQNLSAQFFFAYWMLEHDIDLFVFDYRGYGKSQGEPSPKGTVEDGKAALRYIQSHKRESPLVIFGQSLGGAIALRVAGELRDEIPYKAVVVDSTFHSYKEAARKVLNNSWITWPFQWLSYLVLSDKYGPEDYIGRISPRPLLVVHGTNDKTVAYSLGQRVFELANPPKEFWEIKGGVHTDFMMRENRKYQKLLADWIIAKASETQKPK